MGRQRAPMGVPCRATGYVRRPPGCPPSSHGARCKPRAAWATCATPCATTAARPRSHAHSGAHGGSRRVPRSRAGAPRGHLAHARQRQPRGHRARRLRPEGEAARTIIRRAGAAHAAAGGRRAPRWSQWPRWPACTVLCTAGARRACNARPTGRKEGMVRGGARVGGQVGRALHVEKTADARVDDRRVFGRPRRSFAWQLGQLCAPRGASRARAARRHGPARRLDRVRRARRAHGAEGTILPPGGRDFYGAPAGLYDMKTR